MNDLLLLALQALYFLVPGHFANMAPVFVKGCLKELAIPIDFRKTFMGKSFFGSHKTFRGLLVAIIFGGVFFYIQVALYDVEFFNRISVIDYSTMPITFGLLMGAGAIIGDLIKSFFKRRVDIKPGGKWIPFDQIDYVVGALFFSAFIYKPSFSLVAMIFITSFLGHVFMNHLGFYLGINRKRW